MLVLTRRLDQQIIINDNIVVKILAVTNKQVRIGIEAPRDVTVHREEIYNKLVNDKQSDDTYQKPYRKPLTLNQKRK